MYVLIRDGVIRTTDSAEKRDRLIAHGFKVKPQKTTKKIEKERKAEE
nr:MAG TPA: hypothetical protein [Caudoviricetes sp.]